MSNNQDDIDIISYKNLTKKPSKEFFELVEEFTLSFEKPKEIFRKIVELGRNEGYTDNEIDLLVSSYIKGRISRKTLYNYKKEFLELDDSSEMGKFTHIDDKKVIEDYPEETRKEWNNQVKEIFDNIATEPNYSSQEEKEHFEAIFESDAQAMEDMERDRQKLRKVKVIMPRAIALNFVNGLKVDILTRLNKNGSIEFTATEETITYELI